MAMRKMNEGVSGWNSKIEFPTNRYTLRCIEEEVGPSKSSGSVLVTREWEICCPEPVIIGDRQVSVDGLKFKQYVTVKVHDEDGENWDEERSDKAFGRFRDELLIMGFDPSAEVDDENPPAFAKGKTFDAIVSGKKDVARKFPTPEQLKKHQPGDPIKDANGKEVVSYQLQLNQILGPVSVEAGAVY